MSLESLLKEGKIHRFKAIPAEIDRCLEIAERDLKLAKKVLKDNLDWGFSIAYNAVLQTCRAYMFSLGYRPASLEAHKTVFEFMKITIGKAHVETVEYLDRTRKKRHKTIYDQIGIVSKKEADELLRVGSDFLCEIKRRLKR